jgi:hypothetical protein
MKCRSGSPASSSGLNPRSPHSSVARPDYTLKETNSVHIGSMKELLIECPEILASFVVAV